MMEVDADIQHLLITATTAQITSMLGLLTTHMAKSGSTFNFTLANDTKKFCSKCASTGIRPDRYLRSEFSGESTRDDLRADSTAVNQSSAAWNIDPLFEPCSSRTLSPGSEPLFDVSKHIKEEVEDNQLDYQTGSYLSSGETTPAPFSQDIDHSQRNDGCADMHDEPSSSVPIELFELQGYPATLEKSKKGINDVLVYSIRNTSSFYRFMYQKKTNDREKNGKYYLCIGCRKFKRNREIKVRSNCFVSDPVLLNHICTPFVRQDLLGVTSYEQQEDSEKMDSMSTEEPCEKKAYSRQPPLISTPLGRRNLRKTKKATRDQIDSDDEEVYSG